MSVTEKERIAFEKWVSDSGRAHMLARWEHGPGCYEDLTVHAWWSAWLARAQLAAPASKSPLTDAELADPEYMRAYVAAQHEDFSDLLQANRDCIDHFNQLKADYDAIAAPASLLRRLPADHQRVEPHHADQCALCREATAAIEGQPHPSEVEAGQRGLASLQAAMGGNGRECKCEGLARGSLRHLL